MNLPIYKVRLTIKGKDSDNNYLWVKRDYTISDDRTYNDEELTDKLFTIITNDSQLRSYAHDLEIVGVRHIN